MKPGNKPIALSVPLILAGVQVKHAQIIPVIARQTHVRRAGRKCVCNLI
jgi:hypothetical protein